tara:strand:- start:8206 stop:8862 length:657 start_codon:yes stop_codon:yes gene_type:complete
MFKIIKFNTNKYNFRELVENYLDFQDLENIHSNYPFDGMLTNSEGTNPDQGQSLHKKFYEGMDSDKNFKSLYDDFIENIVAQNFGEIIFQKFPTFRVHQPKNICVFEWHKDCDFNHSRNETNIYMPITEAFDTNTFWSESEEGKEDFLPVEADYGEIVIWKGSILKHGNKINTTGKTRVSFDFRVMLLEDYNETEAQESLTKSNKFTMGNYFDERSLG